MMIFRVLIYQRVGLTFRILTDSEWPSVVNGGSSLRSCTELLRLFQGEFDEAPDSKSTAIDHPQ